jgi:hypothetical protein
LTTAPNDNLVGGISDRKKILKRLKCRYYSKSWWSGRF